MCGGALRSGLLSPLPDSPLAKTLREGKETARASRRPSRLLHSLRFKKGSNRAGHGERCWPPMLPEDCATRKKRGEGTSHEGWGGHCCPRAASALAMLLRSSYTTHSRRLASKTNTLIKACHPSRESPPLPELAVHFKCCVRRCSCCTGQDDPWSHFRGRTGATSRSCCPAYCSACSRSARRDLPCACSRSHTCASARLGSCARTCAAGRTCAGNQYCWD